MNRVSTIAPCDMDEALGVIEHEEGDAGLTEGDVAMDVDENI